MNQNDPMEKLNRICDQINSVEELAEMLHLINSVISAAKELPARTEKFQSMHFLKQPEIPHGLDKVQPLK